jgi:glycosyltransferase involved in cell wall biosynthesis
VSNITYIFTNNRKINFFNNNIQAKEFYYGLPAFDRKLNKIKVIEFSNKINLITKFVNLIDEFLRRFVSLPFYTSKLLNIENIKILKNTDHLIIVPESSALSSLLMLLFLKKKYSIKVSIFVMGLYSKKIRYPIFKNLHYSLIKILLIYSDHIFFLGKGELQKAKSIHEKFIDKFHYFPFSIDTEFWKLNNYELPKKNQIIFVGNDGNRNFDLLIDIASKLNDFKFIFVSKSSIVKEINLNNVKIIYGEWGSNEVSDLDLKSIYQKARLCILPLKESSQPSGQSVALQSMSLGIPVLISDTQGFWDKENFIHEHNILFCNNSIDDWIESIERYFSDLSLLSKVSKNGRELVTNKFNLQIFNEKLQEFLN